MALQQEIDKARADIRTDAYAMSIGEWISLYENDEIDIHPEFQRFFRWTSAQKSRLVESILLGIPIPPIFVSQRSDGIWDVVDGLQRLSTIYELAGSLKDETGQLRPQLVLEATKYLPSLEGKVWDDTEDSKRTLTSVQRLLIKRSKIDVSIILKESAEMAKYELFQRLNTGGSQLSDQEVRNCILIMINRDMYKWIRDISNDANFVECIAVSDRAADEQYDVELALRFLVFRRLKEERLRNLGELGEFLTQRMIELSERKEFDYDREASAFRGTFEILREQLGSDSFRRYDAQRKRFLGGFSVSAFEAVALGIGYNFDKVRKSPSSVADKVRRIWSDDAFTKSSGSGIRASSRVPKTIPFGRNLFAE